MPIIQSLDRALKILDLFDEHDTELKITEISRRMELHKSTVHSLLKTLQEHAYIEQNAETGKYRLGMKLLERGHLLLQSLDIRTIARKQLLQLAAETGQTAHLVILEGKEGVYIDKVEGPRAVIRYSRIGRRIPLHCSSVGKALAAFMPQARLAKLLHHYEYTSHTPRTITDEASFVEELERVRSQGYALDNQENEPGVRCLAVPVYDHHGQAAAAVSISTLVSSVDDRELESLIPVLKRAGEDISKQLGHGLVKM
ncbi:Transcriptional regulator KdgR [Paenibacillus konkukensis]|uniref:Transcriptional regulator KdgR n=1 Tax=Paenibacillus konkukensis TaxID=2020716 RepID=A0ABY4RKC6_9BACL|nr:IclR family transcriptional regulator [Paenibacillus konkukensis]UQZ82932.1 Transcriptional regulator KdgR [Paenibacillus konkukensis]